MRRPNGLVSWLERHVEDGVDVEMDPVHELICAAHEVARARWMAEGAGGDSELYVASMSARRDMEKMVALGRRHQEVTRVIPRAGKAVRERWPSCREMRLAAAGENQDMTENIEKGERERWVRELIYVMKMGRAPVVDDILGEEGEVVDLPTRRFAKGRRASTLRKHVRTWQRATRFWQAAFGVQWPQHPYHMVAYLENRAAEPCGKQVPASVFKTFMFMEHSAEVSRSNTLHLHPSVKNAMEEITLGLEEGAKTGAKQALLMPVVLVEAFEDVVLNDWVPRFARAMAWAKLVKLWGAMRHSDTTGIKFDSISLEAYGPMADLYRTKTTGQGSG